MRSPSNKLLRLLSAKLQQPLPGHAAQRQFAPCLSYGRHFAPAPSGARRAAVVAMLVKQDAQWYIPITRRTMYMPDHAGQICLPGGTLEQSESAWAGARRELHEEIGVNTSQVTFLSKLTPLYLYNSNFHVTPFLAWHDGPPRFDPCSTEVAELIHLPVATLLAASPKNRCQRRIGLMTFESPCIVQEKHRVWGATAMMLGEVRALLE